MKRFFANRLSWLALLITAITYFPSQQTLHAFQSDDLSPIATTGIVTGKHRDNHIPVWPKKEMTSATPPPISVTIFANLMPDQFQN